MALMLHGGQDQDGRIDVFDDAVKIQVVTLHYVHFVKYDDAVSFYDAVSDTIIVSDTAS